jgi:nucleotide-binding universal stress UspA family protein
MATGRALAQRFDAELQTISVADDEGEARRLLAFAATALGTDDPGRRAVVVAASDPAAAIASRADELASCLICLSTRGHGRLRGSVARSVMQRSDRAVVTVGPCADRPGWSPPPQDWPAPLSMDRIVACVDGTANADRLLSVASGWARALEMSLVILTVVKDDLPSLEPVRRAGRHGPSTGIDASVESLVHRWQGSAPEVRGDVLRDPIGPASGIRSYLSEHPAGLVAVASHARSGLQRLLRSDTAASIVHASVAPCLVVPDVRTAAEPPRRPHQLQKRREPPPSRINGPARERPVLVETPTPSS